MLGSIVFLVFTIYCHFLTPKSRPGVRSGPQFRHPRGIAPKISNELHGILATPPAKFHANWQSPGEENRDQTKKGKKQ